MQSPPLVDGALALDGLPVAVGAVVAAAVLGGLVGAFAHRTLNDGGSKSVRRLADELDVSPESRSVHHAVTELTDATDAFLRAANDQGVVDESKGRSDALDSIASGVSRGQIELGTAATTSQATGVRATTIDDTEDDTPVGRAAAAVRSARSPQSPAARTLLDVLDDDRVDHRTVRDVLEDAVDELEAAHEVTRAAERVGDTATVQRAETFDDRLQEVDGALTTSLRPLASQFVDALAAGDSTQSTESAASSALAEVCDVAERQTSTALRGVDGTARGEILVDRLRTGDVSFGTGDETVSDAATNIDAAMNVTSAEASDLLDALRDPETDSTARIEAALEAAVSGLDECAKTQQVVGDVDADDVTSVANEVKRNLVPERAVEATLLERVASLADKTGRTSEFNVVQAFVAHHELTFYRDTLVPKLETRRQQSASTSTAALIDDVSARIDDVERYYERREDHNHTIPRHFVTLARSLHEEGSRLAGGQPNQARGVLEATEALLDHVEELYERNQYSILLRRLRG